MRRFVQRLFRPSAWLLLAGLMVLLAPLQPARASGLVGDGSPASCTEQALRTALQAGGSISFNCGPAEHVLTVHDDLLITSDTTLDGGGRVTISGGQTTRVFLVQNQAHFTVQRLTIRDGKEPGADGRGGAIRGCWRCRITVNSSVFTNNDGTAGNQEAGGGAIFVHAGALTVTDSIFRDNRGINGGAINNLLSSLTVLNSTFINNDVSAGGVVGHGCGGAIYTDGASEYTNDTQGGTITIRGSSFISNTAAGQGGAVFSFVYPPDTVVIEDTSFDSNIVNKNNKGDALGGGLRHGNGPITLHNVTFSNNLARAQGGGFWTDGKYLASLVNVTFAQNHAVEQDVEQRGGLGGAIAGAGNWSCTNCTLAWNDAGFQGGAVWGTSASTSFRNSIIAYNRANNDGKGWNIKQNCGSFPSAYATDGGNNLEFPPPNPRDTNDLACVKQSLIVDPRLGALGDNGGTTKTIQLLPGSPAIDAGNPATCPPLDQRGSARRNICDSGAYEADGTEQALVPRAYLPLLRR